MCVAHEVFGEGEGEVHLLLVVQHPVDAETGDEDRSEQRGGNTDAEGDCKALHRTGTEHDKNETQEEGGHLTVDDGGKCILETFVHRVHEALARAQLFFDTFIYNDVSVNSHCQGQHDTCDTRHCQNRTDGGKHTHQQEDIGDKGDNRHPAAAVVEHNHVEQHNDEGQDEGDKASVDGFLTQ